MVSNVKILPTPFISHHSPVILSFNTTLNHHVGNEKMVDRREKLKPNSPMLQKYNYPTERQRLYQSRVPGSRL